MFPLSQAIKPLTNRRVRRAVALAPVAGMALWLKADAQSYANGDPVGTLTDSSGNGLDYTQTGSNRPAFKTNAVNGKPSINFTGTNLYMARASLAFAGNDRSVFIVYNVNNGDIANTPLWDSASGRFVIYNKTGSSLPGFFTSNNGAVSITGGTVGTVWRLHEYIFASTTCTHYFNAALNGTPQSYTGTGISGVNTINAFQPNSPQQLGLELAELLIYPTALSTGDRQTVENYLNAKYAIY